jgi:hypothetical protein
MRQGDALLAAELTRPQQGDGRFFSGPGNHTEPDPAALNVKDIVGRVTLGKGPLSDAEMNNFSAQAAGGQKLGRIKVALLQWDVDMCSLVFTFESVLILGIEKPMLPVDITQSNEGTFFALSRT